MRRLPQLRTPPTCPGVIVPREDAADVLHWTGGKILGVSLTFTLVLEQLCLSLRKHVVNMLLACSFILL
jgi:hypothetical protein